MSENEFNQGIEEMTDAIMRRRAARHEIEAKAAAMDRVLASWGGMTWEQYQQQPGTDATDTGREPNEHSEEDRVKPQV